MDGVEQRENTININIMYIRMKKLVSTQAPFQLGTMFCEQKLHRSKLCVQCHTKHHNIEGVKKRDKSLKNMYSRMQSITIMDGLGN